MQVEDERVNEEVGRLLKRAAETESISSDEDTDDEERRRWVWVWCGEGVPSLFRGMLTLHVYACTGELPLQT